MSSLAATPEWISQYPMINDVLLLIYAARSELVLFFMAFGIHHLLFGTTLAGFKKSKGKRSCRPLPTEEVQESSTTLPSNGEPQAVLRQSQEAYARGDHRSVLRFWSTLRRCDQVPASHVAQVLEAMQRFKKDSGMICSEVQSYIRRNKFACDITYVNKLLESLAKSLDTEVVEGVFEFLPSLDLTPDSATYEILIHMYFTTRSFDHVRSLAKEMASKKIPLTSKTSLIMLKASLSLGQLDDAIKHYKDVTSKSTSVPTASQAPHHLSVQLAELACREHRLEVVLDELESARMVLSSEMLNALLSECLRAKDRPQCERLDRIVRKSNVDKNARTFQLLMRMASGDRNRISKLLGEMIDARIECTQEVVGAVLVTATSSNDMALADHLYEYICSLQSAQASMMLCFIRFYAESGQHEKACDVYEQKLQSQLQPHLHTRATPGDEKRRSLMDPRTERCLLSSAFQCGRTGISSSLVEATPSDTAKHISLIRASAGRGDLEEAMRIFGALEASGADLTNSLYNTALDACVECRDLRRAEKLMQRMETNHVADAVSFNTLIKAYLRAEGFDKARALMVKMKQTGLPPNHVTYNEMINALTKSEVESRRNMVWDVVDEMKAVGVKPNGVTCSILLKSLKAKSPQIDITRTMELTSSMEEPMDEVTLSSVVEACVRLGRPALLTQKLEELQGSNGIAVTGAHTFGSLIKAYGHAKDIGGAWRCWKEMRSHHIKPTSITIGCMVEAVVANGDVDGGHELISQLLEDDQCKDQINAVVFGSVVKGYGRSKRMERVWAVYREMQSKDIAPSVATFNAIIDSCARNSQMDALPNLLQDMKDRRLSPNLITFSTIIKGLCQNGDIPAALQTLEDLRKTPGLKPDEIVFNTLLDGCSSAGLVVEGERLLAEMRASGIAPSNYTLTVMVRLFGHGRRLDRAFELVEDVTTTYKFRPNLHVHSALIQACITARDLKRAVAVFERASQDRCCADARTSKNLLRSLMSSGNLQEAASVLRTMLHMSGGFGQARATNDNRQSTGKEIAPDDAFINDTLSMLLDRGGEGGTLVAAFLKDVRVEKPRIRIDSNLQYRVMSATR